MNGLGLNGVGVKEKAGEVPVVLNGLKDGVPNGFSVEDTDEEDWLNPVKDGVPNGFGVGENDEVEVNPVKEGVPNGVVVVEEVRPNPVKGVANVVGWPNVNVEVPLPLPPAGTPNKLVGADVVTPLFTPNKPLLVCVAVTKKKTHETLNKSRSSQITT